MRLEKLTGSCRAERRASKLAVQSLCQRKVAPIRERRLHEAVRYTEVLPTIRERSVCDTNSKPFEGVLDTAAEVEAHLIQPRERPIVWNALGDEGTGHVTLVDKLGDEVLALATSHGGELR